MKTMKASVEVRLYSGPRMEGGVDCVEMLTMESGSMRQEVVLAFLGPALFNVFISGKYATGQIVGSYPVGGQLNIAIQVTANHGGFFTFRLCPVPHNGADPSQDCMDRNVLTILNTVS